MTITSPPFAGAEPVEAFELPEGAIIEGYYIDRVNGLRYPYGRSAQGAWACDEFGWAQWSTDAERARAFDSHDPI